MGKYFSIAELSRSDTAARFGIDNTPAPEAKRNLARLIRNLLDPLREAWGAPVRVHSGYRCPALNRAVGGAAESQHLAGEAADITAGNAELNRRLFELIAAGPYPFDQLIDEKNYSWLHISHSGQNRRQILHL